LLNEGDNRAKASSIQGHQDTNPINIGFKAGLYRTSRFRKISPGIRRGNAHHLRQLLLIFLI
ncbi:hypothetical protein, partial [Paenibacillus macerans]